MSNLRLNTIVPDPAFSPTNVINLPGDFRVAGKFTASTIAVTEALSLGNVLKIGEGISFTSVSLGGLLPYLKPASDSSGVLLSGGTNGIDSNLAARIALYGTQWPTPADAGSVSIAAPGKVSLIAGSGTATLSSVTLGLDGKVTVSGGFFTVPSGKLTVGSSIDASSSTDTAASGLFAGGLAVAKSLYAGSGIFAQTLSLTGTGALSVNTAGGVNASGDIKSSSRLYSSDGLTISTLGSATGDLRIFSTSNVSLQTDGGAVIAKGVSVGGDISTSGVSISGILRSTNLTEANVDGVGSGVFLGGLSIGKALRVTGTTNLTGKINGTVAEFTTSLLVSSTDDTLSLGTGSAIFRSGISVAKSAWFGSSMTVTGAGGFASLTTSGSITAGTTISGSSLVAGVGGVTSSGLISGTTLTLTGTGDGSTVGSGALNLTQGGMTMARSLRVGQTFRSVGAASFDSTADVALDCRIGTGGRLLVSSALDVQLDGNNAIVTAAAIFTGGIFVGKTLQSAGPLRVTSGGATIVGEIVGTTIRSTSTLDADSLLSGSMYTPGGLAVSKKLLVGSATTLQSSLSIAGIVTCSDLTPAASATNASVVIRGGLGVGGAIYSNSSLNSATIEVSGQSIIHGTGYFSSTTDSSDLSSGSVICLGGMAVQATTRIGGKLFVGNRAQLSAGVDIYGTIRGFDVTPSDSLTTGAMVLAGGLACAGNLNAGGSLSISGAATFLATTRFTLLTESSTPSDGSAVFTGGVGIGRNLNVGGACSIGVGLSVTGAITSVSGSIQLNSVTAQDMAGILTVRSPAPGLRLTATAAVTGARYVNSIDMFTLGATYTDTNTEAFQVASTGTTGYTLMTRATGTGTVRTMTLQAGATNSGQMVLNTDGTVKISSSTADATTPSITGTASVRVSGGLSVQANVAIGGVIALYPNATSVTGVTIRAGSTTTAYNLVMPLNLPTRANFALVSDTAGTLSWAEMTTANPSFNTVTITATTESTSPLIGSLVTSGGIGTSDNVSIAKLLRLFSTNGNDISLTAPVASDKYKLTLPTSLPSANNYALTSSTAGVLTWSEMTTQNPTFQTVTITGTVGATNTDFLTVQGGVVVASQGILFSSSNSGGGVRLRAPANTTTTSVKLTLPSTAPPSGNAQMLVGDQNGNLSFVEPPSIQTITSTFLAANNVTSPLPVTGLIYTDVFKVDVFVSVTASSLIATALFSLRGYSNAAGYQLFTAAVGDENVGLTFSIDSVTGQILYTSANISGWTNTTIRWETTQLRNAQNSQLSVDGQNNAASPVNLAGLVFQSDRFSRDILAAVSTSDGVTQRSVYKLTGVVQSSGQWLLSQQTVGANTANIVFSVLPSGQVQYTSANVSNWVRTVFNVTQPTLTSQTQASFNRVEVLDTSADSFTVNGGMVVKGDLALSSGNLIPRVVAKTGSESTGELLIGLNCVHKYTYSGTPTNSLPLLTLMVENATYEVSFTLAGAQTLASTTVPSFVQLNANGSTAYGNVFSTSYIYNNSGTVGYTRSTSNALQFAHSATSENASGHGYSGTWKIHNIRADKSVIYNGGGSTGFATGSGWWSDTTTIWSSVGTLTTSALFSQWNVWIKRLS